MTADAWPRRSLLIGAASSALVAPGCGQSSQKAKLRGAESAAPAPPPYTLADAVRNAARTSQERSRDVWRHPLDTLTFMGVRPGMTVVELWPGLGWYTAILAPFLARTGGRLIVAVFDPVSPQPSEAVQTNTALAQRIASQGALFGKVETVGFGPKSGPLVLPGSADMVLTFRNLHNWMAAGWAEKAFSDIAAALKIGGLLGVEEHRAEPGSAQDPAAVNGYVTEAYVTALAQEAGLLFAASSEVNANPKDTRNHPFGVWTLPPTRQSAPLGQPDNPKFDHARYDAIGESDRMTLRFVKPNPAAAPPPGDPAKAPTGAGAKPHGHGAHKHR